jgi:uncharacterized membrane protein
MSGRPEWDYELYRIQELARRINAGSLTLKAAAANVRNAEHRPKAKRHRCYAVCSPTSTSPLSLDGAGHM